MSRADGLVLAAGSAASADFDLVVTPESAGWGYSSLRVLTLAVGGGREIETDRDEMFVVPLQGSVEVTLGAETFLLAGRPNVFAGPTDVAYLPIDSTVRLQSAEGGRFALAGARTSSRLPFRYGPRAEVPVELRGAGRCSRQVRNFGTVEAFDTGAVIACEVITPGGNWSSYPAHKHDQASATESELEEIYYFEIADGPNAEPGFGYHRTSSSPAGEIDILAEVHDRDTVLVPYGWHGPCMAAPGFDMYYLNVMAGPAEQRAWLISDHPDHAWVRASWADQPVDPRLLADTPAEKEND
ncbi:5-deoxy-glucuronate isomerase [Microlunatus panaciterrae]|uniref:5-deoxy-glucuronate isomerase n=1 Tax=Microlunatus panaciterrae TaxID=400768 RepID=A0ABS2RM11_9ACTN|nr:5-deoxy-glucuronate isomerase [Microlunatus panaciterrae]MBM7799763.1 5-deoxy-glucuronate isomerase [Microlunatus panaciterrae]